MRIKLITVEMRKVRGQMRGDASMQHTIQCMDWLTLIQYKGILTQPNTQNTELEELTELLIISE